MTVHTLRIAGRDVEIQVDEAEPTPEAAAFMDQVQTGWGNDQALEDARLEAEVRAMDANAYARFRRQHGIGGPDLIEFLGGGN